jgi:CheY-like chemotaxis protein
MGGTLELPKGTPPCGEMPRLLLIDDDIHVAETLGELLGLEGFRVFVAHEAETGLALARTHQPDLVLCDLRLRGGMDGLGFARACREDARLRCLRLIAVSGYCRPENRKIAQAAGFDGLIGKPVDLAEVHAALQTRPVAVA